MCENYLRNMLLTASMCLSESHPLSVIILLSPRLRLSSGSHDSSRVVSGVSICSKSISSSRILYGDFSGTHSRTRFLFSGEGLNWCRFILRRLDPDFFLESGIILMLSFTHDFTELMSGVDSRFGVKQGVFLVDFFVLRLPTNGVEAGELL